MLLHVELHLLLMILFFGCERLGLLCIVMLISQQSFALLLENFVFFFAVVFVELSLLLGCQLLSNVGPPDLCECGLSCIPGPSRNVICTSTNLTPCC